MHTLTRFTRFPNLSLLDARSPGGRCFHSKLGREAMGKNSGVSQTNFVNPKYRDNRLQKITAERQKQDLRALLRDIRTLFCVENVILGAS
jgi:hypothetical protein